MESGGSAPALRFDAAAAYPYPVDNQYNPDRVELGRLLFFDPILGGEMDTGCGTCHLPSFGMADGRQQVLVLVVRGWVRTACWACRL